MLYSIGSAYVRDLSRPLNALATRSLSTQLTRKESLSRQTVPTPPRPHPRDARPYIIQWVVSQAYHHLDGFYVHDGLAVVW